MSNTVEAVGPSLVQEPQVAMSAEAVRGLVSSEGHGWQAKSATFGGPLVHPNVS